MVEVPPAVEARRKAQEAEYGQWVATQRIYVGGALAFTPGRPVPASHVKRYGYDKRGLVRRSDAAKAASSSSGSSASSSSS